MGERYPKVGSIVVAKSGDSLVYVWPNEYGTNKRCFVGAELITGEVSCMWLRSRFEATNLFKRKLMAEYRHLLKEFRAERLKVEKEEG